MPEPGFRDDQKIGELILLLLYPMRKGSIPRTLKCIQHWIKRFPLETLFKQPMKEPPDAHPLRRSSHLAHLFMLDILDPPARTTGQDIPEHRIIYPYRHLALSSALYPETMRDPSHHKEPYRPTGQRNPEECTILPRAPVWPP